MKFSETHYSIICLNSGTFSYILIEVHCSPPLLVFWGGSSLMASRGMPKMEYAKMCWQWFKGGGGKGISLRNSTFHFSLDVISSPLMTEGGACEWHLFRDHFVFLTPGTVSKYTYFSNSFSGLLVPATEKASRDWQANLSRLQVWKEHPSHQGHESDRLWKLLLPGQQQAGQGKDLHIAGRYYTVKKSIHI